MPDLFDILFGSESRPLRRDLHLRRTVDSDGNPIDAIVDGQSVTLSRNGSLDRIQLSPDRFFHCGCNAGAPAGGQCGEPGCRRVSCQRCFGRCSCGKPVCLEHSRYFQIDQTHRERLCGACFDRLKRKRFVRTVVRGLLSPFVRFNGENP